MFDFEVIAFFSFFFFFFFFFFFALLHIELMLIWCECREKQSTGVSRRSRIVATKSRKLNI